MPEVGPGAAHQLPEVGELLQRSVLREPEPGPELCPGHVDLKWAAAIAEAW